MLLPDQLKALWQRVEHQELSKAEFQSEQDRLLATYRKIWQGALCLETYRDLPECLLADRPRAPLLSGSLPSNPCLSYESVVATLPNELESATPWRTRRDEKTRPAQPSTSLGVAHVTPVDLSTPSSAVDWTLEECCRF
jgi:hypothetical protein